MNRELLNILSDAKETNQKKLLDYLDNNLSPEERHEVEKFLIDSDFENDAAEGLEQITDRQKLPALVNDINKTLAKKLSGRRRQLFGKKPELTIPVIATFFVLLLVIVFYFLMKKII